MADSKNAVIERFPNPKDIPYLLYDEAFLYAGGAEAAFNQVKEDPDDIFIDQYNSLIKQAKIPLADSSKAVSALIGLQSFTFNANWESRLQPFGYYNVNQNLGVDLAKKLKTPQSLFIERANGTFSKQGKRKDGGYIAIQPLNPESNSIDLSEINDEPWIYVSSPYGIAKAESNIADIVNDFDHKGLNLWMISSIDNIYKYVISGGIPERLDKISTEIHYPTSYTKKNSVNVKLGRKNDIILYDGSHKNIDLGKDDDIALPALLAYQPSLLYGKNVINNKAYEYHPGRGSYLHEQYAYQKGFEQGKIKFQTNSASPQDNKTSLNLNKYFASEYRRSLSAMSIADADYTDTQITVGGQTIQGKDGNDILYGLDPSLYSGFQATEKQSNSNSTGKLNFNIFNDPKTIINWNKITLSGGSGLDQFIIGDLGRINTKTTSTSEPYYTILGDKDDTNETNPNARIQKSWGDRMASDAISLTAHYDFEEQIVQDGINIDLADPGASAGDIYDLTNTTRTNFNTIAGALGIPGILPFPAVNGMFAAINLLKGIQKYSTTSNKDRRDLYRKEIKQKVVPPGNWNQTIRFPDWDPLDRITIRTMPITDPKVKQAANKWSNINFSIIEENNQSAGGYGLTIQQQTSVNGKAPLVYLNGLKPGNGSEYGFQTFNFFTGSHEIIKPLEDITFLGVLSDITDEDIKINYTENAYLNPLEISKDNPVFLWNSQGLSEAGKLNQYRSAASSIQIGIDSRKFGWYTDIKVKADNPSEADFANSTLNYWDTSSKSWASVSFQEFKNMPKTDDLFKLGQKAKFDYWTAQDNYADQLMNLAASDAANENDIEFYKSRDDGAVKDPITGKFLLPSDEGYQEAALSEENYAGAFGIWQNIDSSIDYIVEVGYKLSPFISTTFENGRVDYIFAYDEAHAGEARHTRNSMVQIDDSGVIRFEDVIGGDYDYNDAVLDPSLNPQLASHLASAVYSNG